MLSFRFYGKHYLQPMHGTAIATKMAVALADIFMPKVETEILNQSALKTVYSKTMYRRHIFPLDREEIMQFIEQANKKPPDNYNSAEISETETTFLVQAFIKAKDSEAIQFLMCVRTSKARFSDFSEQTILKKNIPSRKFKILNHGYGPEKRLSREFCSKDPLRSAI